MCVTRAPTTASPLRRAIFEAFKVTRQGLIQRPPTHPKEILRQPLFGNGLVLNSEGLPFGLDKDSAYSTWANHNTFTVNDIWNPLTQAWKAPAQLQRQTKSRILDRQLPELLPAIPWTLPEPSPPSCGEWVTTDMTGPIRIVFHVTDTSDGLIKGRKFIKQQTEELVWDRRPVQLIPPLQIEQVRVVETSGLQQEVSGYNPTEHPQEPSQIWLFGSNPIIDLPWDPQDWSWRRIGSLKEANFFNFSMKHGYKIGLSKTRTSTPAKTDLLRQGYSISQYKLLINRLWHNWLPRKISSMYWLAITSGLPIEEWRAKAKWSGNCKMCGQDPETVNHALHTCPMVAEVWLDLERSEPLPPPHQATTHGMKSCMDAAILQEETR